MKKTILASLLVSASIGSQVFNAGAATATATMKVGVLSFALTDVEQVNVMTNDPVHAPKTFTSIPFDFSSSALQNCVSVKYVSKTVQVNTLTVIQAIEATTGNVWTKNAKLVIVNYDNPLHAPPYPPYLLLGEPNPTPPPDVIVTQESFNGPRDPETGELLLDPTLVNDSAFGEWPIDVQSDWVNYDPLQEPASGLVQFGGADTLSPWPKGKVYISDPANADTTLQCFDVSEWFSFEEAYCHFCWDTQGRVTQGQINDNSKISGGTPCILPTTSNCQASGNGTTKWFMFVKFNNSPADNLFLGAGGLDYGDLASNGSRLIFQVSGVVNYPWTIKPISGIASAFGTMTMSQANGNGIFPYCGVFTGNVKITETTDAQVPVPCFTTGN